LPEKTPQGLAYEAWYYAAYTPLRSDLIDLAMTRPDDIHPNQVPVGVA